MLEQFNGIEKEREAIVADDSRQQTLEQLMQIGEICAALQCEAPVFCRGHDEMYNFIRSRNVSFDEIDLKNYVYMIMQSDSEDMLSYGIYTGALLSILTERNESQNKGTKLHINGYGGRFDYMFSGAKQADDVIIEHFSGGWICSNMIDINSLMLLNNSGDSIARDIQKVKTLISKDNHGDYLCGRTANAEQIYSINDDCVNLWSGAGFNGHINFGALVNPKLGKPHCAIDVNFIFSQMLPSKYMKNPEEKYSVERWIWGHMTKRDYHTEIPLIDELQETDSIDELKRLCDKLHETYKL
jgi:hypothetical protein